MNELSAAGLSETEAKTYKALLTRKAWLPSELAKNVSETRTNIYKILDRLVALELAERLDEHKKLHYRAGNPTRLLELARELRRERERAEQYLESTAHELMRDYVKTHEQAAVQFFQGKDDIVNIFNEIAHAKTPVLFLHTRAGIDFYGFNYMHNLRMLAVEAGVQRFALTPDSIEAPLDYKQNDKQYKLRRTWLREEDYTAQVEWGVFDDKIYIISYGQEALGMIIESRQIANAFREIYALLEQGERAQPWHAELPIAPHKKI